MEPDKDKIIKLIQDILEDQNLVSLTAEEKSIILYQDVIETLFKEVNDHYAHIAWAFGNYPSPGGSN